MTVNNNDLNSYVCFSFLFFYSFFIFTFYIFCCCLLSSGQTPPIELSQRSHQSRCRCSTRRPWSSSSCRRLGAGGPGVSCPAGRPPCWCPFGGTRSMCRSSSGPSSCQTPASWCQAQSCQ
ncbi:hypothetical protein AALO_G00100130, partial [Alosa alosa]